MEECQTVDERTWYLNAAKKYGWSKSELLKKIRDGAWLKTEADKFGDPCYTGRKTVGACQQNEEDSFYLSWEYLQESDGRVYNEGPDQTSGTGGAGPGRVGGNQHRGNRESGLSSGPEKTGGDGIDCAGKTARQLTNSDYEEYDLLIGIDRANLRNMYRISGGDFMGKMHLLLDYTDHPGEVEDPWYTDNFEATWRDVLEGCHGLMKKAKKKNDTYES